MPEPSLCCAECGAVLPMGRLDGLCPACLLDDSGDDLDQDYSLPSGFAPPTSGPGLLHIPGCELLREINRGGMGIVYEARQEDPPRRVAVKMLLPHLLDEPGMVERFRFEARAMAELDHPGVLPVYQVGESGDLPFFCMKVVNGGSLAQRRSTYAGAWGAIARLLISLAEAVQYAHDHGVLHRDIKPGNVLFDDDGRAYVTDFGLAKRADGDGSERDLTRSAAMLGTPNYLPPEWASGAARRTTTAGDIYGLGAILYELLTERPPHVADQLTTLLRQIADEEIRPPLEIRPDIPRDLAVICQCALDREPARRFASASAFADDLRAWLEGRPITSRPVNGAERLWRLAQRNPIAATLATALAVFLVAGGGILWRSLRVSRLRLHDALVAQSNALRQAGQLGHREEALDALRRAAELRPDAAVRAEMISALSMASLTSSPAIPCGGAEAITDAGFTCRTHFEPDGRLTVRDLASGKIISRLPEDIRRPVAPGPFSPDGSLLVVKPSGSPLRLWDCREGRWVDDGHSMNGGFPLFSPDGSELAVVQGKTIQFFDPRTGTSLRRLDSPVPTPRLLAWSADGSRLAISQHATSRLTVLAVWTGRVLMDRTLPDGARFRCGAWSPDGATLYTGTENFKIYQWRLTNDNVPRQLTGHRGNVVALATSPDGSWCLSQSEDGTSRVWNVASGQTEAILPYGGTYAAFSKDSTRIVCQDRAAGTVVLSMLDPSHVCRQLRVPAPDLDETASRGCWAVSFSPDGTILSTGDLDGIAHFQTASGTLIERLPLGYTWAIRWLPDSSAFISASSEGLQRWEVDRGGDGLTVHHPPLTFATGMMNQADLSADGSVVALATTRRLSESEHPQPGKERVHSMAVYDTATGGILARSREDPRYDLDAVAVSPDHTLMAASVQTSGKRGVLLWNLNGIRTGRIATKFPESNVLFANRSEGGLYVGDLHELVYHDAARSTIHWRIPRPERAANPPALSQSKDGALLAATLDPSAVSLIDPATRTLLATIRHSTDMVPGCIALSPDAAQLAVFGLNHVVQLWDLRALRSALQRDGLDWEDPQ